MYAGNPLTLRSTVTWQFANVAGHGARILVGKLYEIHGARTVFLAEAHDWQADTDAYFAGEGEGYTPGTVGVHQDPESALAEIERRFRAAVE